MFAGQLVWRGETIGIGTEIEITKLKGVEGTPATDYGGVLNPQRHGGQPGRVLAQDRVIDCELEIIAVNTASARARLRAMTGLTSGDEPEPLLMLLDDQVIRFQAQLTRRDLDIDEGYFYKNNPVLQWRCPDPRRYLADHTDGTGLPVDAAGLAYPFPYPSPYNTTPGSNGDFTALNVGNEASPPIMRITATSINQPDVLLVDADGSVRRLDIDLNLASGDELVLDVAAGTALLNGIDRYGQLSGTILEEMLLRPGSTVVQFRAFSGSTDARLDLYWSDAEM